MQDGSRQILTIWKREWDDQKSELLLHMAIEMCLLLSVFLIYSLKSSWLFSGLSYIGSLPPVLYAFVGFPEVMPSGSLRTFIEFLIMCFHVWLAYSFGNRGIQSIWREEQDNSIYLICNQWCSRCQLAYYKLTWTAVSMLATYFALSIVSILFLLIGSVNRSLVLGNILEMFGWTARGCFSLLLLLVICVSYAMCSSYKEQTMGAAVVVFGTLTIGNLFKVRDLCCWVLERLQIDSTLLRQILGWLDGLYWLSPLSWINPFNKVSVLQVIGQLAICAAVAGCFVSVGMFRYRTRELGW